MEPIDTMNITAAAAMELRQEETVDSDRFVIFIKVISKLSTPIK
jgi:hypothetical protein